MINRNIFIIILLAIIVVAAVVYFRITIKANWIVFLTVMRGILSPSCFWWTVSDTTTTDTTGVDLYNELSTQGGVVPLNIAGNTIQVVMDNNLIKEILDHSPDPFGVGRFKYDFFKSFMKKNVGVSEGCPWKRRRALNEQVLDTDQHHQMTNIYNKHIYDLLSSRRQMPKNFSDFSQLGKELSTRIVFGEQHVYQPLFDMFDAANSFKVVLFGAADVNPKLSDNYYRYMKRHIYNPRKGSLISYIADHNLSEDELLDQIPHWVFPINGTIAITVPRLLLMLYNHPQVYRKLCSEIQRGDNRYLRKCILEMFRLNNPVISTFRTLLRDYSFDNQHNQHNQHKYKKGTQFLILNNPVLRTPEIFPRPNQFIPERWNRQLEKSYYAIMFNQGPQRCPGKELAITLVSNFITLYLQKTNFVKPNCSPQLNTSDIPQMINPCNITFS